MHEPAQWNDDPKCGHLVAHEFQTQYCTYIRATRLLSLQRTQTEHPDEVIAILALQAIELWLRVVRNDLEAARTDIGAHRNGTFKLSKLLNRASTLIRLLDRHTDLAESILLDDLGLELPLSGPLDDLRSIAVARPRAANARSQCGVGDSSQLGDPRCPGRAGFHRSLKPLVGSISAIAGRSIRERSAHRAKARRVPGYSRAAQPRSRREGRLGS